MPFYLDCKRNCVCLEGYNEGDEGSRNHLVRKEFNMKRALPIVIVAIVTGLMTLAVPRASAQSTTPSTSAVLVLPFSTASAPSEAWIGKAVQQDLLTDLTQGTTAQVIAPAGISPAADADEALKAARDKNASIVVYGQAQNTGKEVRLSGQVLDVATGKPITALKATGPTDDLFHLEDALAGQVFRALPANLLTATARQGMQAAQAQAAQQQGQANAPTWPNGPYTAPNLNPNSIYGNAQTEVQTVQPPVYAETVNPYDYYDTVPDTGYYSTYPAYSYGYPYWDDWWPGWGLGFFVSPGFGFHHHGDFDHHHGDFGHGDFGHNHFGSGFNTARSGSAFLGSSRFGSSGFRSATPRSTFGGFHSAIGGGFHSSAGAFHGGGFHGGASAADSTVVGVSMAAVDFMVAADFRAAVGTGKLDACKTQPSAPLRSPDSLRVRVRRQNRRVRRPAAAPMTIEQIEAADLNATLADLNEQIKEMTADDLQDGVHRSFTFHSVPVVTKRIWPTPSGMPREVPVHRN